MQRLLRSQTTLQWGCSCLFHVRVFLIRTFVSDIRDGFVISDPDNPAIAHCCEPRRFSVVVADRILATAAFEYRRRRCEWLDYKVQTFRESDPDLDFDTFFDDFAIGVQEIEELQRLPLDDARDIVYFIRSKGRDRLRNRLSKDAFYAVSFFFFWDICFQKTVNTGLYPRKRQLAGSSQDGDESAYFDADDLRESPNEMLEKVKEKFDLILADGKKH